MQEQPGTGARATRIESPDNPRLRRMRSLSRFLDNSILLPGGHRIGVDPLLGLIPAAGDLIAGGLSLWMLYDAALLGLPKRVLARMLGNVLVESIVGSVPGLGDVFDAVWKANARNMRLVEQHYSPALKPRDPRRILWLLAGAAALLLLIWGAALFVAISLIAALANAISGG